MDALYFLDQSCYPPQQRSSYKALLDMLLDRDCAALVAEEIGEDYVRVIAALIVLGDPWRSRLFIVSLMVKYEFRRLGIAQRLLDWAERLARGFHCNTLLVRSPQGYGLGEVFLTANGFTAGVDEEDDAPGGKQGILWMREVTHGEKESDGEGQTEGDSDSTGERDGE